MLRDALKQFAPSLIEYLDPKPRDWRKVERKLKERNAIFEAQLNKSGEPLAIKITIYDLMAEAFLGNATAAGFLSYIDSIASGLDRLLPERLQPSARLLARNLFLDFCGNTSTAKYLEKVAELAAILYILEKTGANPLGFEVKIPDRNTSLDLLVELESGHHVAVEILNVWIDDKELSDEAVLHAFLDGRIKKKIREKIGKDLSADQLPFHLLLVLWFQNVETVRRYANAIIGRARRKELPACVLLQYLNERNQKAWMFSSVVEMVSKYQIVTAASTPIC